MKCTLCRRNPVIEEDIHCPECEKEHIKRKEAIKRKRNMKKQNDHIVTCHCSVNLIKLIKHQSKKTGSYIVSFLNYDELAKRNTNPIKEITMTDKKTVENTPAVADKVQPIVQNNVHPVNDSGCSEEVVDKQSAFAQGYAGWPPAQLSQHERKLRPRRRPFPKDHDQGCDG